VFEFPNFAIGTMMLADAVAKTGATTIVGDVYPGSDRARVQGWLSGVWALAAIIGPVLGAFIVQHLHWAFVFWINLPIGAVTIALLCVFLHEEFEPRQHQIDYLGSLLLMLALGAMITVLVQAQSLDPAIAALLIGKKSAVLKVVDVILGLTVVLCPVAMTALGIDLAPYRILPYVAAALNVAGDLVRRLPLPVGPAAPTLLVGEPTRRLGGSEHVPGVGGRLGPATAWPMPGPVPRAWRRRRVVSPPRTAVAGGSPGLRYRRA